MAVEIILFWLLMVNDVISSDNDRDIEGGNEREATELFCIVCMEAFSNTDIIKKCDYQCAGNFHVHCWEQCIQHSSKCPHCRKYINNVARLVNTPRIEDTTPLLTVRNNNEVRRDNTYEPISWNQRISNCANDCCHGIFLVCQCIVGCVNCIGEVCDFIAELLVKILFVLGGGGAGCLLIFWIIAGNEHPLPT